MSESVLSHLTQLSGCGIVATESEKREMMIIKTTFTDMTDEELMDYMDAILNIERANRRDAAYAKSLADEVADSIDALDIEMDRRYDVFLAGSKRALAHNG